MLAAFAICSTPQEVAVADTVGGHLTGAYPQVLGPDVSRQSQTDEPAPSAVYAADYFSQNLPHAH